MAPLGIPLDEMTAVPKSSRDLPLKMGRGRKNSFAVACGGTVNSRKKAVAQTDRNRHTLISFQSERSTFLCLCLLNESKVQT